MARTIRQILQSKPHSQWLDPESGDIVNGDDLLDNMVERLDLLAWYDDFEDFGPGIYLLDKHGRVDESNCEIQEANDE